MVMNHKKLICGIKMREVTLNSKYESIESEYLLEISSLNLQTDK